MSDAINILIESNPSQFISAAHLGSPMLTWFDQSGLACQMPMPDSFVAFPVDDVTTEVNGVQVVAITDARAKGD